MMVKHEDAFNCLDRMSRKGDPVRAVLRLFVFQASFRLTDNILGANRAR